MVFQMKITVKNEVNMEYEDEDNITSDEDFLELALQVSFPRRKKIFHHRPDHFTKWNNPEFFDRFRITKTACRYILSLIEEKISSLTLRNNAVSAEQKLLLTLRYYATGSFLAVCGDFIGIHKSTASRIVRQVSHELALLRPYFINFPETEAELDEVRQEFFNVAKFPKCIGALDCTHVRILSPGGPNAENYRNRKGFFSVNVQTICDARMRIQDIVARWPGSAHDSIILRNSAIRRKFEKGDMGDVLLVADSGYALKKYIMTPFENPVSVGENRYNEAQIRTRNPVERSYGVWKRRFPILAKGINVKLENVQSIIVATAILHNIATHFGEQDHKVPRELEKEIAETNALSNDVAYAVNNNCNAGDIRRTNLVTYFESLAEQQ